MYIIWQHQHHLSSFKTSQQNSSHSRFRISNDDTTSSLIHHQPFHQLTIGQYKVLIPFPSLPFPSIPLPSPRFSLPHPKKHLPSCPQLNLSAISHFINSGTEFSPPLLTILLPRQCSNQNSHLQPRTDHYLRWPRGRSRTTVEQARSVPESMTPSLPYRK